MSEQRFVYVLDEGEYSDYHVICAFEDEASAKAANAAGIGDNYRTLLLLRSGDPLPAWTESTTVSAVVGPGGGALRPPASSSALGWDFDANGRLIEETEVDGRTFLYCTSPDAELAMKKVSDRYAKLRAERLGL